MKNVYNYIIRGKNGGRLPNVFIWQSTTILTSYSTFRFAYATPQLYIIILLKCLTSIQSFSNS